MMMYPAVQAFYGEQMLFKFVRKLVRHLGFPKRGELGRVKESGEGAFLPDINPVDRILYFPQSCSKAMFH